MRLSDSGQKATLHLNGSQVAVLQLPTPRVGRLFLVTEDRALKWRMNALALEGTVHSLYVRERVNELVERRIRELLDT